MQIANGLFGPGSNPGVDAICGLSLLLVLTLACENIRLSSLFAAGDVSRGGTSATQRQKLTTPEMP